MLFRSNLIAALATIALSCAFASANEQDSSEAALIKRYTQAHSYPDTYNFDKRDGWMDIDSASGNYGKRDNSSLVARDEPALEKRNSKKRSLLDTARSYFKSMRGKGDQSSVIITWYTGHDLLYPSCWANGHWAPTDESFVAALTAVGWKDRPQCYKFVELCHGSKCIFVRVVDSCAGCAQGSAHVDLTKAAFKSLVPLSVGITHVKMRHASEPEGWSHALWGPQEKVNREASQSSSKSSHSSKNKRHH